MKKVQKIGLAFLLILSVGVNIVLYYRVTDVSGKLVSVNKLISSNVERNIRQSMRYSKEFKETGSPDALKNLQRTIQELSVTYKHWVDLNQKDSNPNEQMTKSLSAIEALRNAFIHHLDVQFQANGKVLEEYDIEFLDKAYEGLDRLLMIYLNLDGNIAKLRNANRDYGLIQVAGNIEDMTRLYRHSITPNRHPDYITFEDAEKAARDLCPNLEGLELDNEKTSVNIKDGIHYYELKFMEDKEVGYLLWVDAINGSIRSYEARKNTDAKRDISRGEAFVNASTYLQNFYNDKYISEFYEILDTENKNDIYSFKFTPVIEDIPFAADTFTINIDETTGTIIKFSNEAINLQLPQYQVILTPEEIQEANLEAVGNMEYLGLAAVRSFATRYMPTIAHSFKTMQKDQQMTLFYDIATGIQIHQIINVYEPIN